VGDSAESIYIASATRTLLIVNYFALTGDIFAVIAKARLRNRDNTPLRRYRLLGEMAVVPSCFSRRSARLAAIRDR
jgi:hypothetical protein